MTLDKNFFIKQHFSSSELEKYKKSSKRDFSIAEKASEPAVAFHFAYMAFIKMGIYSIAKAGYRVKSRVGHHRAIIENFSRIMNLEDINVIGDKMRKDRNLDLYDMDRMPSPEEIKEHLEFIRNLYVNL
jgi:hypothetical protein